jgi:flagellar hook-length control protein FliK
MQINNLILSFVPQPRASYPTSRTSAEAGQKGASFADAIRDALKSEASDAETPASRQQRIRAPDKRAHSADTRTDEPERGEESEISEASEDPVALSLAAASSAPAAMAQNTQNAEDVTATAAEQTDVSVLGGKTTDWSLPEPGEAVTSPPPETQDTARMPDNPAADTIREPESEPCPPENVNVQMSEGARIIASETPEAESARRTRLEKVPETGGASGEGPVRETTAERPVVSAAPARAPENKPDAGEQGEPRESGGDAEKSSELRSFSLASERIASDGALRAAADASPGRGETVPVENVVPAMIERIELMTTEGQKTMSLDLKPEYLGRVNMTLVSEAGGVAVRIRADDPGVRAAISGEIAGIIERLSERGVRVSGVELTETHSGGAELGSYGYSQESRSDNAERDLGTRARARYGTAGRVRGTGDVTAVTVPAAETASISRADAPRALISGYDSRGRWNDGEIYDGDAYDGYFGVEYSA